MTDIGLMSHFFRIEVFQFDLGIFIYLKKYAGDSFLKKVDDGWS